MALSWKASAKLAFWNPQERDFVDMFRELSVYSTEFNVQAYGAKGDGIADDAPAIRLAITAAIAAGGGRLFFPYTGKLYRIGSQVVFGVKFVNEWEVTSVQTDYSTCPSYSSSARTLAIAVPFVDFVFESGAGLWGDFAASNETALLYYGAGGGSQARDQAFVHGGVFVGQAGAIAGVPNTSTPGQNSVPTGQMGVFIAGAKVHVDHCNFRDLNRGLVTTGSYWSTLLRNVCWRVNDGVAIIGGNTMKAIATTVEFAHGNAMVVSGQEVEVDGLFTEQAPVEYWAVAGNGLFLSHAYLEDIGDVTHTDYALKFGIPAWQANTTYSVLQQGVYVNNDTGKTYQLIQGGTSAASGGPTGTGTSIADNGCVWKYVGTNGNTNQCSRAFVEFGHTTKTYGRHFLLAGCSLAVRGFQAYITNGSSNTRLDDTNSSLTVYNCGSGGLPLDTAAPGYTGQTGGGVSRFDGGQVATGGGLFLGSSALDRTGANAGGIQMGSEFFWKDNPNSCVRWARTSAWNVYPANSTTAGVAITPLTNQVSLNFGSIASTMGSNGFVDITWSGNFAKGDQVDVAPMGAITDGVEFRGVVTSASNVRVYAYNFSNATWNVGALTYNVAVRRQVS